MIYRLIKEQPLTNRTLLCVECGGLFVECVKDFHMENETNDIFKDCLTMKCDKCGRELLSQETVELMAESFNNNIGNWACPECFSSSIEKVKDFCVNPEDDESKRVIIKDCLVEVCQNCGRIFLPYDTCLKIDEQLEDN